VGQPGQAGLARAGLAAEQHRRLLRRHPPQLLQNLGVLREEGRLGQPLQVGRRRPRRRQPEAAAEGQRVEQVGEPEGGHRHPQVIGRPGAQQRLGLVGLVIVAQQHCRAGALAARGLGDETRHLGVITVTRQVDEDQQHVVPVQATAGGLQPRAHLQPQALDRLDPSREGLDEARVCADQQGSTVNHECRLLAPLCVPSAARLPSRGLVWQAADNGAAGQAKSVTSR
jgi:hypothetical protein